MPVTRWVHLEATGGDPWILPIWSAANAVVKAGKIPPLGDEFGELGLHISTRLDILPCITRRIARETSDLYEAIKGCDSEYISTETKQGNGFPANRELKFCLIADIDALLFELNSCWELMRKLLQRIRSHIGRPIGGKNAEELRENVTSELRAALGSGSDRWFSWLDKQRNFVAHEGTPYVAIDVTYGRTDLLVMKENLTTFGDPKKFFRGSEMIEATRTIIEVMQGLQRHLIELLTNRKPHNP